MKDLDQELDELTKQLAQLKAEQKKVQIKILRERIQSEKDYTKKAALLMELQQLQKQ